MKKYWKKITTIFNPGLKITNKSRQKSSSDVIIEFITSNSTSGTNLLDINSKQSLDLLNNISNNFNGNYFGINNNLKQVKQLKKTFKNNNKINFFKENQEKLTFKNNYFEIVLVKDIIENQQYYTKILSEAIRVCKKNIILSMSIKPSLFLGDKIKLNKNGIYENRYNQGKLFSFLHKHGFKTNKKIFEDWQSIIFVFNKQLK